MRCEDTIKFELVERQLAVKEDNSHSWVIHLKKLLTLSDLPQPLDVLYTMAFKEQWHGCVLTKVHKVLE